MLEEKNGSTSERVEGAVVEKNLKNNQIILMVALFTVLASGFLFYNLTNLAKRPLFPLPSSPFTPAPAFQGNFDLKQFESAQAFEQYLENNLDANSGAFGLMGESMMTPNSVGNLSVDQAARTTSAEAPTAAAPDRYSTTNVQVLGIDEPDIVKTNGQHIFLSTQRTWYNPTPMGRPMMMMMNELSNIGDAISGSTGLGDSSSSLGIEPGYPRYPTPDQDMPVTNVLDAFPPAGLSKIAKLDLTGQMLLNDTTLVVLGAQSGANVVTGFDVSKPASPLQSWQVKLSQNNQVVAARMMKSKLYVITQTSLYDSAPCPYIPLTLANGDPLKIACTDIYYPDRPTSNIDSTFTSMIINPKTGEVEAKTSLVGSGSNSVIYVSPNAIYLTYQSQADMVKIMSDFIAQNGLDLFPSSVVEKLIRLQNYDISKQAKMMELQSILGSHQRSLSDDDRLKLESELQNRMQDYMKLHSRALEQTMIVKLSTTDLSTAAIGGVPGTLLGQFSMDEYNGNLRVATTFGQQWTQFGQGNTASDVYVLDGKLKQLGAVTDLGIDERIYAVRFLGNKGFVVTFRQVDPFYILDLSNPSAPQKTGELKIPGYSSYLHPLSANKIVGIGKENNQIKISLFDVSDDTSPKELSKYQLDEYWSEILSTHHAFLLDEKNQIFFIPGSKGGYVFSYANNQLKLVKAISQNNVQRALFINDYLYVIGDDKITVLSEADWQVVKDLEL